MLWSGVIILPLSTPILSTLSPTEPLWKRFIYVWTGFPLSLGFGPFMAPYFYWSGAKARCGGHSSPWIILCDVCCPRCCCSCPKLVSISFLGLICDFRHLGTCHGQYVSMGVYSNGEYSAPKGVIFSYPVTIHNGTLSHSSIWPTFQDSGPSFLTLTWPVWRRRSSRLLVMS